MNLVVVANEDQEMEVGAVRLASNRVGLQFLNTPANARG